MAKKEKMVVVGAGLVGSLWAMFLAKQGHRVRVFEKRGDLRKLQGSAGRSINLIVTARGFRALDILGLRKKVEAITVPVIGRMVHSLEGESHYQPYGKDDSERNYSVSRGELNGLLITEAEKLGVEFFFDSPLTDVRFDTRALQFEGRPQVTDADRVFGTDGSASVMRQKLMETSGGDEDVEALSHGYKELLIPAGADGGYLLEKHALHIWPRGEHMLMALPNTDGSFTVTLYLAQKGKLSFENLNSDAEVKDYFQKYYPNTLSLMPHLTSEMSENPTGHLGTVKCFPWRHEDWALLMGDASHGIVPFFGQGMNSGFEDCTELHLLIQREANWGKVFEAFEKQRKPDTDAIAEMAIENFVEMRDRVGDPEFLFRKQVEHELENRFPRKYRSRYAMVVYSQIPYSVAQSAGRIQQEILATVSQGLSALSEIDFTHAEKLIDTKLTPFLKERGVTLEF